MAWIIMLVCAPVGAVTIFRYVLGLVEAQRFKWQRRLDLSVYQELINRRFPSIRVLDTGGPGRQRIEAFMIPDGQGREFMEFLLDELWLQLDERGIKSHGVTPTSKASTMKYYPELYEEFQKDLTLGRPHHEEDDNGSETNG